MQLGFACISNYDAKSVLRREQATLNSATQKRNVTRRRRNGMCDEMYEAKQYKCITQIAEMKE